MPDYSIDSLFDTTSPYFNGALKLSNPPSAQNAFTQAVDPTTIGDEQSGENLKNLGLDTPVIVVQTTDDLQSAITKLNQIGGGTISLLTGTYTIKSGIVGYSSIRITGVSPTATIIDFASTSANISFTGTNVYTTGTITSISSGVNVVGSGTSWLTNVVEGKSLFIGTRWYVIAVVVDDTHITLAESYGDSVTMPGASYRIAYPVTDIAIENVGVKNSTGTALAFTDCRRVTLTNLQLITNNVGFSMMNVSENSNDTVACAGNTSDGIQVTNVGLCNWTSVNSFGNGGNGLTGNNWKTILLSGCANDANTGDGYNLTTVLDATLLIEASSNGGQGVELVSACSNVDILSGTIRGNTSDGIKFTASSDDCHVYGCDIKSNGGYGVNIVTSTCDNNIFTTNNFELNTSGAFNDSGTGTLIRGNTGINDNATSASPVTALTFSSIAGEAINQYDAITFGVYQSGGGITLDNHAGGTWTASGVTSGTQNVSFTVGSGSGRLLVLFVISDSAGAFTTPTYNGSNLTADQDVTTSGHFSSYYIVAPSSGSNTLAIPWTGNSGSNFAYEIYSFANAHATEPDTSGKATTSGSNSVSQSITPNVAGGLIVSAAVQYGATTGATSTSGFQGSQLEKNGNGTSAFDMISGITAILPFAESHTMSATWAVTNNKAIISFCIKPLNSAVNAVVQASAANDNSSSSYRSNGFIGFAPTAYSAGDTVTITVSGAAVLSGLTAGKQYYLSDTAGLIATSAGTNTRKVGISLTTTQMLLTNIW